MNEGQFNDDYEAWLESPSDPPPRWFDMTLTEVPKSSFRSVPPSATVSEAAVELSRDKCGALLVVEGEALVGIVTERDVVERVVARGLDPGTTPVGAAMTACPGVLCDDALLAQALRDMVMGDYRHVPVVDDTGKAVAMVTMRDILRHVSEVFAAEVWTAPSRRPSYPPIPDGA